MSTEILLAYVVLHGIDISAVSDEKLPNGIIIGIHMTSLSLTLGDLLTLFPKMQAGHYHEFVYMEHY